MPDLGDSRLALGDLAPNGAETMGLLQTGRSLLDPEVEEFLTKIPRSGSELLRVQLLQILKLSLGHIAAGLCQLVTHNELGRDRKLVRSKTHRLAGDSLRNAIDLKKDVGWTNDGYPRLDTAFAGTHSNF